MTTCFKWLIEAVHKKMSVVGGPLQTRGDGVLQMWTFALFGAKTFGFYKIYGVSATTRGVEPMWTF